MDTAILVAPMYVVGGLLALAGGAKLWAASAGEGMPPVLGALVPSLQGYEVLVAVAVGAVELGAGLSALVFPTSLPVDALVLAIGGIFLTVLTVGWRRGVAASCGCLARRRAPGRTATDRLAASSLARSVLIVLGGACGIAAAGSDIERRTDFWTAPVVVGYALLLLLSSPEVAAKLRRCGHPFVLAQVDALRALRITPMFKAIKRTVDIADRPVDRWRRGCTWYMWFPLLTVEHGLNGGERGVLFSLQATSITARLAEAPAARPVA